VTDFGTGSERIGDESKTLYRSRFVSHKILWVMVFSRPYAESVAPIGAMEARSAKTGPEDRQTGPEIMVNKL